MSILNDFEHVADKVIKVIPKDYELMMQKLNYKVVICHNLMMLNWQRFYDERTTIEQELQPAVIY